MAKPAFHLNPEVNLMHNWYQQMCYVNANIGLMYIYLNYLFYLPTLGKVRDNPC